MANKMPSMLALLGLLAVAGYQNRDKISAALKGSRDPGRDQQAAQDGLGGILSGLGDLFGGNASAGNPGAESGGGLAGGLGDLMDRFRQSGQTEVADSWVTPGVPTRGLTTSEVEQAIGNDNLEELSRRTGLSREDLLTRLATAIPENVDRMTPEGKFPNEQQARDYFIGGA
jgi:uncharacterized protein YidB (DUF937 family)